MARYYVGEIVRVSIPEEPPLGTAVVVEDVESGSEVRTRFFVRSRSTWVEAIEGGGARTWIQIILMGNVTVVYVPKEWVPPKLP